MPYNCSPNYIDVHTGDTSLSYRRNTLLLQLLEQKASPRRLGKWASHIRSAHKRAVIFTHNCTIRPLWPHSKSANPDRLLRELSLSSIMPYRPLPASQLRSQPPTPSSIRDNPLFPPWDPSMNDPASQWEALLSLHTVSCLPRLCVPPFRCKSAARG